MYECINWTRQEHVVGLSALDAEAFRARVRASPPPETAGWDPADRVTVECVAQAMPEADARMFLDNYVSALQIPGWKVLVVRAFDGT